MNRADSEVTPKRMPACRVTARPSHIDTRLRSSRAASTARRLEQLLFLAFVAAVVTASGQVPTWKPHGSEPLEKYDNPPAQPRKIQTSPRMISRFGIFTSYQVNVDASGNNIIGDAANGVRFPLTQQTTPGWQLDGGSSMMLPPTSGRLAGVIPPMAGSRGRFRLCYNQVSSEATR